MSKKCRLTAVVGSIIAVIIAAFIGISITSGKAFTGINKTLTEQQLYNSTNTYNVNAACFDSNGNFTYETRQDEYYENENQYHIKYDMSEKNGEQVKDKAQITVLTHGLGVGAEAWSNDFSAQSTIKTNNFVYDADSLINKISEKAGGANIYWAKIENTYNDFKLYDITNQKVAYDQTVSVDTITDISKHIIIVFDCNYIINNGIKLTDESNDNVYYAFNNMLSKIIYDVKEMNGGILPKVNLIGHSRGGITNLQYALDHPDLVATMVSLGTPFFGSTTARLFGVDFMGACDGLTDILNAEMYYGYNTRWNNNYDKLYKNIKAHTYGSYHTLQSLKVVIQKDYAGTIAAEVPPGLLKFVPAFIDLVNVVKLSLTLTHPIETLIAMGVNEILGYILPESEVSAWTDLIIKEINLDYHPMFMSWYNDILVPFESQQGKDSGSLSYGGGNYKGFNRHKRVFTDYDKYVNYEKISQVEVPVGHNLEARDIVIINNVVSFLDLGINEEPAFVTYKKTDNSVAILRYNGKLSTVTVPEKIDGYTVTEIAPYAFEEQAQLTKIILPDTIKTIGACAFVKLENLEAVEFTSAIQLAEIGEGAFVGCSNLKQFGSTTGEITIPQRLKKSAARRFTGLRLRRLKLKARANL